MEILSIRVNKLDLVSIVVSWLTSPCKSIVLSQLFINFFSFLFSQRNKKMFQQQRGQTGGREGHGGIGLGSGCGGHAHHITLNCY